MLKINLVFSLGENLLLCVAVFNLTTRCQYISMETICQSLEINLIIFN